jgi:hypothetical protein
MGLLYVHGGTRWSSLDVRGCGAEEKTHGNRPMNGSRMNWMSQTLILMSCNRYFSLEQLRSLMERLIDYSSELSSFVDCGLSG